MYQIDSYLELPDLITIDARKNFINKKFKYYAITIGVNIKSVLVKSHNSIKIVKRYYSLL